MKRRTKRILYWTVIIAVIAGVMSYMKFYNGNLIYLSTGMKNDVVLKVDGQKATKMEVEILFSDARNQYEDFFGEDVWTKTIDGVNFESYAKDQIKSKLIRIKCMNVLATQRGVVLDRTESANVEKAVDEYMGGLTSEQITSMGITRENLVTMFSQFAVADRLFSDMTSQVKTEVSSDDARVITIQYICTDTQENINAAKVKLNSGESFFYVAREYNSDGEYEYELKRGEMESVFEDAAYNLKTGETSDVLEADGKYYIIKCVSDNEKTKTEANKNTIIENIKLEEFNSIFESYESKLYVEFNDKLWNKCKVSESVKTSVNYEDIFSSYFH